MEMIDTAENIATTIEISLAKKFVNFVIEIPPIKTINPYIKGY